MCGQPTGLLSISLLDHVANSLSEEDLITALFFIIRSEESNAIEGPIIQHSEEQVGKHN